MFPNRLAPQTPRCRGPPVPPSFSSPINGPPPPPGPPAVGLVLPTLQKFFGGWPPSLTVKKKRLVPPALAVFCCHSFCQKAPHQFGPWQKVGGPPPKYAQRSFGQGHPAHSAPPKSNLPPSPLFPRASHRNLTPRLLPRKTRVPRKPCRKERLCWSPLNAHGKTADCSLPKRPPPPTSTADPRPIQSVPPPDPRTSGWIRCPVSEWGQAGAAIGPIKDLSKMPGQKIISFSPGRAASTRVSTDWVFLKRPAPRMKLKPPRTSPCPKLLFFCLSMKGCPRTPARTAPGTLSPPCRPFVEDVFFEEGGAFRSFGSGARRPPQPSPQITQDPAGEGFFPESWSPQCLPRRPSAARLVPMLARGPITPRRGGRGARTKHAVVFFFFLQYSPAGKKGLSTVFRETSERPSKAPSGLHWALTIIPERREIAPDLPVPRFDPPCQKQSSEESHVELIANRGARPDWPRLPYYHHQEGKLAAEPNSCAPLDPGPSRPPWEHLPGARPSEKCFLFPGFSSSENCLLKREANLKKLMAKTVKTTKKSRCPLDGRNGLFFYVPQKKEPRPAQENREN